MKKILAIIIAFLLSAGGVASATEFTLEWPNHADFLRLVDHGYEYLRKSLYNTRTNSYRWPETLSQFGIDYNDYK